MVEPRSPVSCIPASLSVVRIQASMENNTRQGDMADATVFLFQPAAGVNPARPRVHAPLLNGLPLPSPEPLRRVVPLDLFPTNLIDNLYLDGPGGANTGPNTSINGGTVLIELAPQFLHRFALERLDAQQGIDEEPVALVRRHPPCRRMGRGDEAELL